MPKAAARPAGHTYATADAAMRAADRTVRGGTLAATWDYQDAAGEEVMRVGRFNLPAGEKEFRPVHRVKAGCWRIGDPSGPLPLYLLNQIQSDGLVYICEGEKATDAARALGLPAVTSAHGSSAAAKTDWTPLAGRDVVILPDADEPGMKYAREVARILARLEPAARVRIVPLPGLPPGGDIVEFIAAAGTAEQIHALAAQTPELATDELIGGPVLTCLAAVQPREISWLWPGRVALGRITLLVGRPGEGKSFLTTDMAARVSTGTPWPDGSPCGRGSVLLVSAEDDPGDTIRPRLNAHHADCSRVHLLSAVRRIGEDGRRHEVLFTLADVAALEDALRRIPDCRMIVVDPIGSFLGGGTDAHRDNEVRGVLAPVARLAERYGPAVLVVAHRRKGTGTVADDLALGSRAFTGIARTVWHLSRDPNAKARRLLLPGKNNLAPEGDGLAFAIAGEPASIVWEREPVAMSADDALAQENADDDAKPGPEPEARNMAGDWLRAELADYQEHAVATLKEAAEAAGVGSWKTCQRAAQTIGVISQRATFGGGYIWRLPRPAPLRDTMQDTPPKNEGTCPPVPQGEFPRKTDDSAGQDPLRDRIFYPVAQGANSANGDGQTGGDL